MKFELTRKHIKTKDVGRPLQFTAAFGKSELEQAGALVVDFMQKMRPGEDWPVFTVRDLADFIEQLGREDDARMTNPFFRPDVWRLVAADLVTATSELDPSERKLAVTDAFIVRVWLSAPASLEPLQRLLDEQPSLHPDARKKTQTGTEQHA